MAPRWDKRLRLPKSEGGATICEKHEFIDAHFRDPEMSWEVDQAVTQAKDDGKRMEARLQELGEEANNLEDALSETEADRDRLAAELHAVRDELAKARNLIGIALPHVQASAGAEHMLDGFRPRRRPIDDDVDAIRAALANNVKDGEVALGPWIPTSERLPEKPGKKSYEYVWCLVHHPNEGILLRPWNCEHLVWDDEQMDDFWCNPRDVTHWIPIAPLEDSIRAALANNAKDEA